MVAIVFMSLSAAVVLAIGVLHLVYTFSGPTLLPRDPALRVRMSETAPVISKETTMWRAWIGFNASHAMGAILFATVYGFLAIVHPELLFRSPFLLLVGLAMLGGFIAIGKRYWFRAPVRLVSIALLFYVLGVAASWVWPAAAA